MESRIGIRALVAKSMYESINRKTNTRIEALKNSLFARNPDQILKEDLAELVGRSFD